MQPQNQYNRLYLPSPHDQRTTFPPHSRPQTSHSPAYNQLPPYNPNKSHGRGSSYGQVQNSHGPQKPNMTQSRVSMANSHVSQLSNMMAEHADIFPQDLVFLLRGEQKNINFLKEKIEKEKGKVQNDFAVFRTEIDHILEDIKISVQAELDLVYKSYITKYAEIKGEVQELRMLRKEILMNNQAGYSNTLANNATISNKDLIHQIEKDAEHMRNFKIYGYLGELQRQKLEPILQLANELVFIGAADSFYRNKDLTRKLKDVKQHFGSFIKQVFDNLSSYVVTPQFIAERERHELENSKVIPHDFDHQSIKLKPFEVHYPNNQRNEEIKLSKELQQSKKQATLSVGSNQQGCVTRWCEEVRLNRIERVQTDHSDSILCIYFLNDEFIATGSKDTTINIYSLEGKKVRRLKGHEASICCLSSFKNLNGNVFLASGSDHGCSSLILWDIRSWTIASKIQAHVAAVTGIVDLQDGRHIATGSYDKKITVYSIVKNQIVLSLSNNKTSVTGMIMNADKSKLVTSGLDKSISTWSILRKNGIVEEITHEKLINASELICQLQPSLLKPEIIFCAARDGTLKIINLYSGREEKSLSVSSNSLIELVSVEREMNPDGPLLITCSAKQNSLILAKMDSGVSSTIKLPTNLGIDYGCGIGPKIVLSSCSGGMMAIVNQQAGNPQFSMYEMLLK